MYFLLLLLIAFAVPFLISAIACKLIVGISTRMDFVDRPAAHKQHGRIVPYGGGIGIALGVLAGIVLMWFVLNHTGETSSRYEPKATPMMERTWNLTQVELLYDFVSPFKGRTGGPSLGTICLGIFAGALVLLGVGLRDDKKPMGPFVKLLFQVLAAAAVVTLGVRGGFLIDQYGTAGQIGAWLISVGWIVFITNSFNLLDNCDGLAAGVATIAALCLCLIAYLTDQTAMGALMAALAGSCAGFLLLNRYPAKLFMGDAGSLFIGFLFGSFTITFTYYHLDPEKAVGSIVAGVGSPLGLLVPPLLMAIPLYDTFSVIYIRLSEGRSIFVGDRRHFSHRLLDLGLSVPKAIGVIYLAELAMGLGATLLIFLPWTAGLLVVGQSLIVFTIITLLEHAGRQRHRQLLAEAAAPVSAHPPTSPAPAAAPATPPSTPLSTNPHQN